MPITEPNLEGMLRLLRDRQAPHLDAVINQLALMADPDIEALARRASAAPAAVRDNLARARVRAAFVRLNQAWADLAAFKDPPLEAGLILLARTRDDDAEGRIRGGLDSLAQRASAGLAGDRAFDTGLAHLARVLNESGFAGNREEYDTPDNSYMHRVVETRRGIPISLCCVAILVGRRLDLPVHGIAAPGHFLGFYGDAELGHGTCFDPFAGFSRMTSGEVSALHVRFAPGLAPLTRVVAASDRAILARTIRNLVQAHGSRKDVERAQCLGRWLAKLGA